MNDSNRRSFWSSIPGMMTGAAGVLTAVVGLITVLIQLDIIGKDADDGPDDPTVSTSVPANQPGATGAPGTGAGAANAPAFSLTPKSVTFDTLLKREEDVTLRNDGSVPLTVATQLVGRDIRQFGVDARDCTSATVARGGECTIKVSYAPLAAGDHVARLQVTVQGTTTQAEVALAGKRL